MATCRSDKVIHVSQAYRRAAYRRDAYEFITKLTEAGFAVLIIWDDGKETENRLRYNRRFYPTPPTWEEVAAFSPEEQQNLRDIECFERTGQSPCLWQLEQPLAS